ncbi:glycoside hydrolase family 3 N-terminal domain-containing protein [Microbacterium sp. H1-D42]|uniref:glycoside hydrolase family 3 N-terminal domain-containing protein n=1 Tax=Microbacterium sp. H1-D42 TaxID=2925844 RepID=UPI001F530313|nr:glycoside hydrolase family 3 N-terminal domain-containing protein [Microbacterium sp. H1-D42]UNK72231.1 glycoside hydrolase family 3 protein [Microbacterium sp. H1-D42]
MSRRTLRAAATALLAAVALVACAPPATSPQSSPAATASTSTPTPTPTPDPVETAVDRMSTAEQAASVVMGHVPGTDPVVLAQYMASGLGGFILMGDNIIGGPENVRAVTGALTIDPNLPPLIAIDQEGGVVSRLPWDDLPAGRGLQSSDAAAVQSAFRARADLVAAVGANVNFGVIADVPMGPSSFIASRALGTDPDSAAMRVRAAVQGEKGIVLSTLKHFPDHGAAAGDSHHLIPTTDVSLTQWRSADAVPFIAGIDAGAEVLMFGHLAYTAVDAAPASLSARWHEIARDDLGFDGLMITDDLGMLSASENPAYADPVKNAVDALVTGNDMVLMIAGATSATAPAIVAGIVTAVGDGRLPAARLRDAAEHVMTLRMQLADAANG